MQENEKATFARRVAVSPIIIYRRLISPALKPRCRYYPTCSEYFELSVKKYGIAKGSLKGAGRIIRCHPFATGGYDPP